MDAKFLYFTFEGRINRSVYWIASLLLFPIYVLGVLIDIALFGNLAVFFYLSILLVMVPSIALQVKRCHDRDKSGWFLLVGCVPFISIWYAIEIGFLRGTEGPNTYGADPLGRPTSAYRAVA